jgi:hypothetical protein
MTNGRWADLGAVMRPIIAFARNADATVGSGAIDVSVAI